MKTVGGSNSVRGKKKRRKAINQAPRKPETAHHTKRRRRLLTWSSLGPTVGKPAAAAAFEVPTAGVPTYLVASSALADVFAASGFGLSDRVSGPAIWYLQEKIVVEISRRRSSAPRVPPFDREPLSHTC